MGRRSEQLTLADGVIMGLTPALLIGLVTSLVYFVLEVIYRGDYLERLHFIFFCFIVAAVLISRIAMTMGRPRALMYAAALAIATAIAMNRLTEIPANNPLGALGHVVPYLLIALAWWCIDVLTHDCTHTGAEEETGLLDMGLLKSIKSGQSGDEEDTESNAHAPPAKPKTWLEQYTADREAERRRHRPGFWLIIFSLAALPMFALGQAIIPVADSDRRRYIFWLLTAYVGCGLGLLLTTSFLGLRRYLRQRKLEMPSSLTTTWLGIGALLIFALLTLATLLPRPAAEYSIPGLLGFAGSKKRDPDRFAVFNFEGEKQQGKGQQSGKGQGVQPNQQGGGGQKDPNANSNQSAQGKQGQGGQGNNGQQQSGGRNQNNQRQGQGQNGQQSGKNQGNQEQSQNPNDPRNKGGDKNQTQENDPNKARDPSSTAPEQKGEQNQQRAGNREQQEQDQRSTSSNDGQRSNETRAQPPQFEPPQPSSALMNLLKWLLMLAIILATIYFAIRYRKELLEWLRSLLAGWSWHSTKQPETAGAAAVEEETEWRPPPAFSTFRDPFETPGRFQSNEAIVRYSYAALESWAYEQNLGRKLDETPLEFIRRLSGVRPKLEKTGTRVVDLYSLITYAKGKVTKNQLEHVRLFWQTLPSPTRLQPAGVE